MLQYNTNFMDNQAVIGILRRACNCVDKRLMDHGIRVSYIVSQLLQNVKNMDAVKLRDLCFLAALHDIGAYKTEEIDRMVQFETEDIWEHSVYGYLFIKYFSPLPHLAPAILFHHTPWTVLQNEVDVSKENKFAAQIIYIADRLDIWLNVEQGSFAGFLEILERERDYRFMTPVIDLVEVCHFTAFTAEEIETKSDFLQMQQGVPFHHDEIHAYLYMIIFAIDFRSRHTVTHTMTTTSISSELAGYMNLNPDEQNQVICGALLHDLGKIGIPVEILEYPGKLSPQAMSIMRQHVDITAEILGDDIPPAICQIALRHHEKLDGSGYPCGLLADQLGIGERIVALADIVSALAGTRSYKEAFSKERIVSIVSEMQQNGLMDTSLVDCMFTHFNEIMERTAVRCQPIMEIYEKLQAEYAILYKKYASNVD